MFQLQISGSQRLILAAFFIIPLFGCNSNSPENATAIKATSNPSVQGTPAPSSSDPEQDSPKANEPTEKKQIEADYVGTVTDPELKQFVLEVSKTRRADPRKEWALANFNALKAVVENREATSLERIACYGALCALKNGGEGITEEQKNSSKTLASDCFAEGNPIGLRGYALLVDRTLGSFADDASYQEFLRDVIRGSELTYVSANLIDRLRPTNTGPNLKLLIELATEPSNPLCKNAFQILVKHAEAAKSIVPKVVAKFDEYRSDIHVIQFLGEVPVTASDVLPTLRKSATAQPSDHVLKAWAQVCVRNNLPVDEVASASLKALESGTLSNPKLITEVLGSLGKSLAPTLITKLKEEANDPSGYQFQKLSGAIGPIGPGAADAVPILVSAIPKLNPAYKQEAVVKIIGQIGTGAEHFVPVAKDLLNSETKTLRVETLKAIGEMGSGADELTDSVMDLGQDTDPTLAIAALRSLGSLGQKATSNAVKLKKIADENDNAAVAFQAAVALIRLFPDNDKALAYGIAKVNEKAESSHFSFLHRDHSKVFDHMHQIVAKVDSDEARKLTERLSTFKNKD